jgi:hypothetical protein
MRSIVVVVDSRGYGGGEGEGDVAFRNGKTFSTKVTCLEV